MPLLITASLGLAVLLIVFFRFILKFDWTMTSLLFILYASLAFSLYFLTKAFLVLLGIDLGI
jgi:hypothetical protein